MLSKKQYTRTNTNCFTISFLKILAHVSNGYNILFLIFNHMDVKSLCNVKRSSFFKQIQKVFNSDDVNSVHEMSLNTYYQERMTPPKTLYELIARYERKFPASTFLTQVIPTPIVCACEHGYINDVKLFVDLHRFHKYIINRGVNGYRNGMTVKDMLNEIGKPSEGIGHTPLMIAARNERSKVVQYLIEKGVVDPNVTDSSGWNALHHAAIWNGINTEVIQYLLRHMTLDAINKQSNGRNMPLDLCYEFNHTCIQDNIIALLRSKGARANWYTANGNRIIRVK